MIRVALHGVPRSGTTWLSTILDSSPQVKFAFQPLFSYEFKSALTLHSTSVEIVDFFSRIQHAKSEFVTQSHEKNNNRTPDFLKENIEFVTYKEVRYHHLIPHLLETDNELFMFLVLRNPLSVLASWVKAPKEFDPKTMNFIEEWRDASKKNEGRVEEFYGFNKWKEFALMAHRMQKEYPERCLIVNYAELLGDTEGIVEGAFSICGIPFSSQTEDFIRQSKSRDRSEDAYSVYRIKRDDEQWRDVLPDEIVQEVRADLKGTELEKYLY